MKKYSKWKAVRVSGYVVLGACLIISALGFLVAIHPALAITLVVLAFWVGLAYMLYDLKGH